MWTLLHGFMGSSLSWSPVVDAIRPDRAPLAPTLSGHGRDWRSRAVSSFDEELDRLLTLISGAAEPRMLCGYSLGARLALGLLAREPGMFDAAVLIGVHPGLSDEADRVTRRGVDAGRARLLRERGLEVFVADWEAMPLFASQRTLPAELQTQQRRRRLDHDAEGLATSLDVLGLADMPDYRAAIAGTKGRTTLVAGSLDTKFVGIAEALADADAGVDLEIIEGVGHNVVLEAPQAIAAILRRAEGRAS